MSIDHELAPAVRASLVALLLGLSGGCDEAPATSGAGDSDPKACVPASGGEEPVWWRDADGRAVIYRGVNVNDAAKRTDDLLPPVDAADFEQIAAWGLTSIRLLTFWEAIEPTAGTYDDVYLDSLRAVVEQAGAAGLDVLLDPHQDVYGEGFSHTGFPAWTCDEALYATYERPDTWFLGYFEPEVIECFDRFWASDELRGAYVAAMVELVTRVGDHPAVIGFEMINEPYWGSYRDDRFEERVLQPFYEEVAAAVGDVAPHLQLFAEPSLAFNLFGESRLAPPFGCPTWTFAPHFYPLHTETGTYSGDIEPIRVAFAGMRATASALGAPLGITEIGTVPGAGSVDYIRDVHRIADEVGASLWLWEYGPGGAFAVVSSDGTVRDEAASLQRPYAHRIAGDPVMQHWDPEAGVLTVTWREPAAATAPTVIVAPLLVFPAGFELSSTDPDGAWSSSSLGGRIEIVADPGSAEHTLTVTRL